MKCVFIYLSFFDECVHIYRFTGWKLWQLYNLIYENDIRMVCMQSTLKSTFILNRCQALGHFDLFERKYEAQRTGYVSVAVV